MSTTLQRGGNAPIGGSQRILIALSWKPQAVAGMDVDASAFMLKADGKVRSDTDLIFYNQPRSSDGALEALRDGSAAGGSGESVFAVDFGRLDPVIERVAFTVTIHDGQSRRQNFGQLRSARCRVVDAGSRAEITRFDLDLAGFDETAMIFGEVYLRNGAWKFRAVGQGYKGGLGPLATSFGVSVDDQPSAPPAPPAPPPPAPPKPTVNLSKITLEKKGQSVSLEKKGAGFGEVRINLNWSRGGSAGFGGLGRRRGGIDLDLGCFVELQDGHRTVVQALGEMFGSLRAEPYVELSGDDRTGDVASGEDLRINGDKWSAIRRVLVYAYIYEGAPSWAATDGVVTVTIKDQPPLEVRLSHGRDDRNMCAICVLENEGGAFKVTKLAEYFQGHEKMDRHYGWGFRWVTGSKD